MKLSEETKNNIIEKLSAYTEDYAVNELRVRQSLGQFFTPPELVIKMIEMFEDLDDEILDPCAGSGCLIIGCILAGADPKKCYANEIDTAQYAILKENLKGYGVPAENITNFDALKEDLYCQLKKGNCQASSFFKTKIS